jgi:Fe-S oxidoreductase
MGGSLSGEHGDGQARAELIHKMYSPELMAAFRDFKAIWDPRGMMNPGKMVDANPVDADLRLGSGYRPARVTTRFHYPQDEGSFAKAALRCVGVGECRREGGGTMCPSYMVTREEKHSTRGRARLLFEMLQGNPLRGGWRSEEVHEALDLCLACKGCKGDCPVNVDMATYKAEFLSHYFAGRLRPRSAYAFGLIYWWAGIAARFPSLVNFTTQAPLLSSLAKLAAGIAPQRRIPRFAPETFRHWFSSHRGRVDGPPVLLWPDTFNNHFHPRTAIAAVQVLEAAGFRVRIPEQILCCGRPLYDFGMLGLAKRLLGQILDSLRPDIRAGVPIVGLEPSCVSVFRDELINFFPEDADARRLSQQCMLLSEFLEKKAPDFQLPRLRGKAIVHGHCHHKALMKMTDEERVLGRMGVSYELLDSGCCGMAGAFGFEKGDHYEVSIKAGERVLLPAVRKATADTMVIADGFSCREQVTQAAGRTPVHLAEGIQLALDETNKEQGRPAGSARDYPSAPWRAGVRRRRFALLAGLAGLGLFLLSRRRRRLSV